MTALRHKGRSLEVRPGRHRPVQAEYPGPVAVPRDVHRGPPGSPPLPPRRGEAKRRPRPYGRRAGVQPAGAQGRPMVLQLTPGLCPACSGLGMWRPVWPLSLYHQLVLRDRGCSWRGCGLLAWGTQPSGLQSAMRKPRPSWLVVPPQPWNKSPVRCGWPCSLSAAPTSWILAIWDPQDGQPRCPQLRPRLPQAPSHVPAPSLCQALASSCCPDTTSPCGSSVALAGCPARQRCCWRPPGAAPKEPARGRTATLPSPGAGRNPAGRPAPEEKAQ
ncbi:uncharacterized protein LOC130856787 [Hippopotamus amphibius kiboko]|uniref:uncharacterized protein LOC130856787 n=1 Tax=Hippopotamus amphibius kiboko TaxID=575201 RepID=UPI0025950FAD|nr:uncharacterized protein LOC130856787 [Hippopotamus amphibius kiboko]